MTRDSIPVKGKVYAHSEVYTTGWGRQFTSIIYGCTVLGVIITDTKPQGKYSRVVSPQQLASGIYD